MSANGEILIRPKFDRYCSAHRDRNSLFVVRPEVDQEEALNDAACLLDTARSLLDGLASDLDHENLWAALIIVEMAKAAVDAVVYPEVTGRPQARAAT